MKCFSHCTADSYQLNDLVEKIKNNSNSISIYEDVVHINKEKDKDIFYFSYGCVVMWGVNDIEKEQLLEELSHFEIKPTHKHFVDDSDYFYNSDEKTYIKEETDEIFLESEDVLIKLSISFATSQGVKLSSFEDTVSNTIQQNRSLTDEFARNGSTSLSRAELSKRIGALFNERISINLHSDLLDKPEFFWRKPRYEPYYYMTVDFMDIPQRLDILHKRLDVLNELYKILSEELKHSHSSRLEWIVIFLILIEVILVLLKDFLKIV